MPRGRDHPRSRGVYPGGDTGAKFAAGSSPLARGLLDVAHLQHARRGIIPARAGFTAPTAKTATPTTDHPRSRGGYGAPQNNRVPGVGSSPLARGLLQRARQTRERRGIIPARAGFTPGCCRARHGWPDHPRSRGVYDHYLQPEVTVEWIIPARAGFTSPRAGGSRTGPDHPRSRGVYFLKLGRLAWGFGSSPLARGLHAG